MDMSDETLHPGHYTAREKALVFIELWAGWVLKLGWIFWGRHGCLAPVKI